MECFMCDSPVNDDTLICMGCGIKFKEEKERGKKVVVVDYDHEQTRKALQEYEED